MHIPSYLESNPLVNPRPLPYGAIPFDDLKTEQGDIKTEYFEPAVDWAIDEARTCLATIRDNLGAPTFENTVLAMAFVKEELKRVLAPIIEIQAGQNTKPVQDTYDIIQQKTVNFDTELVLDQKLFDRIQTVYDQRDILTLSPQETTWLHRLYDSYANEGAKLQGPARERFKILSAQAAEHETRFGNNITNHDNVLQIAIPRDQAHRLRGVPPAEIESFLEKGPDGKPLPDVPFIITMQPYPLTIIIYAEDEGLRREVFEMIWRRGCEGEYNNTINSRAILTLRHEIAGLLGYENAADQTITTGHRMESDYRKIITFLRRNAETYQPVAETFYEKLATLAGHQLNPWDTRFYINKLRQQEIGLDEQEAQKYLELEKCLKGMFGAAEKLYGIRLEEVKGVYPVKHDDVRTYEVFDIETGNIKSVFTLDLYARKFKSGGAWMNNVRDAGLFRGAPVIPFVSNNLNFDKKEKVYLTPDEYVTLWHEFGHGVDGMMGEGEIEITPLSGINRSWDTVEVPSQESERFALTDEVLESFATNDNGDVMPMDLRDKLRRSVQFDAPWQGLRQAQMALEDMILHSTDPATIGDLAEFERGIIAPYIASTVNQIKMPPHVNSFTHIMNGGYRAGYNVYRVADVVCADVWEPFAESIARGEGAFPPDLCKAYNEAWIKPGATRPASEMHAEFKRRAGCPDTTLDHLAIFRAEGIPVPPEIERAIIQERHLQR
jgi:peptidyl-dipeptidase Dcp